MGLWMSVGGWPEMATFTILRPVGKRISREHFSESMKLILVAFIFLLLVAIIGTVVGTTPTQLSGTTPDIFKTMYPPPSENNNISDAMYRVTMQQPGIYNSLVSVDDSHMGITIQRGVTGDDNAIAEAVRQIIANYAWFAVQGYRGYLRIGLVNGNKQIVTVWEVTAADAAAHVQNSVISTAWVESRLNTYTGIRYYWADRYGDVTKTVDTPGGRLSPSNGKWLS
jgi:hypothetical protein